MKKGSNEYLNEKDEPETEFEGVKIEVDETIPKDESRIGDTKIIGIGLIESGPEPPRYKPTDIETMMHRVLEIPNEISWHEARAAAILRKTDGIQKHMSEISTTLMVELITEKDTEGKKKYSNEETRQGELRERKNKNIEYQVLKEELIKQVKEGQNAKRELNNVLDERKAIDQLTELMRIKLRM